MSASPPPGTAPSLGEGVEPYLSVVLPVYDEGQVLERNLGRLVAFLDEQGFGGAGPKERSGGGTGFEIVAVDDGSRDDSRAILDAFAAADPRLVVLGFEQNRGKGAAVREGMLATRGHLAVFMDADLSTPLEEFGPLVAALESGHDAVLGNRRSPGSRIERHQPWLRETLGKGFTLLTQLLLVPGVHDFTCGFKGFRRDAARAVFSRSTLDRWAFDAELVVIISEQGLRLAQVPVRWKHEDDTKVRVVSAATRALFDLLRVRVRRMRGLYR
ncbi:Undecaprenyl-phosphate 4-deoxy-4-formamido-L-arabinose transferase [Planctomycetes bacterium Pla163]|uniref:dolichyl-phosphate beta-glucosyltransferase n=1 Tax=Rohdeia mirabilis TaxID=2528008 RepID=A0A518CX60_9BACT|nr:Undecaprenyl-phosphate 4-deoxy-4-formamido-L-arabinose transferase [Planctomycetes bacterium Pla163]